MPSYCQNLPLEQLPSPCFVVDETAVERNLQILADVQARSGAKVLAALKAFSMWHLGSLSNKYLSGTCASGLHEALLGKEYYGGELHTYSAGFKAEELERVLAISDHIVFNSLSQWQRFQPQISKALSQRKNLKFGLRINPLHSEASVELYDPCAKGSRLGVTRVSLNQQNLASISGLHFHTLCEQGFQPLARTLAAVEQQFGDILPTMEWVNFGGGHHITAPDYDREALIELIKTFSDKYSVQVYLEPGEAIAINTGVLVAEVVDIIENAGQIAILDTSATCHMPDVLEMPYRPDIRGADAPNVKPYTYRLGGMTCLAGDVIGDYSFDTPLNVGDRLIFDDMSHYTMVKTTTFNGINLPAIATWNDDTKQLNVVKRFGYEDFKQRLS